MKNVTLSNIYTHRVCSVSPVDEKYFCICGVTPIFYKQRKQQSYVVTTSTCRFCNDDSSMTFIN